MNRQISILITIGIALYLTIGCAAMTATPPKEVVNSIGMKLVLVPSGKFVMGMPKSEKILYGKETEHEVEITHSFYMGAFEVTQEQFEKVMGHNPSDFSATGIKKDSVEDMDTKSFPVDGIDWEEAVEFCRKLSTLPEEDRAGRIYRLPTEAEWEYACRAKTKTRFSFGDNLTLAQANFEGRFLNIGSRPPGYLGRTCTVGSYNSNAWGLYDMHGNVWEWCYDWYQPDYYLKSPQQDPQGPETGNRGRHVRRGGNYGFFGVHARSGARFPYQSDKNGTGLRVVSEIPFQFLKKMSNSVTHQEPVTNSLGMEFVYILPGRFIMGTPVKHTDRNYYEKQHIVTLTKGYYLQTTEVTQGQWQAVMGNNPSYFKHCGEDCSVENVSWNDVQKFIETLNQREEGTTYRLPTEAEWEYAARAGSKSALANGDISETMCGNDPNLNAMGWHCGNSLVEYDGCHDNSRLSVDAKCAGTHPVAQKQPNAWGLYDMHGNVFEWCQDWFHCFFNISVIDPAGPPSGDGRILRGGSWNAPAEACRSTFRYRSNAQIRGKSFGFRLAIH